MLNRITLLLVCSFVTASALAGQVIVLNPGQTHALSSGDVVACMGAAPRPPEPPAPPPQPKLYQCKLRWNGSPGQVTGRASYDICEAIRSAIYECRMAMGPGTDRSVIDTWCVSNSRFWGAGVTCIDNEGNSADKPAICPGVNQ